MTAVVRSSSCSSSPQLLRERLHQGAHQRELQHISCVCANILLCGPQRDLPALPGPDLCAGWVGQLCARECTHHLTRGGAI